jgi:hypothetical protein
MQKTPTSLQISNLINDEVLWAVNGWNIPFSQVKKNRNLCASKITKLFDAKIASLEDELVFYKDLLKIKEAIINALHLYDRNKESKKLGV